MKGLLLQDSMKAIQMAALDCYEASFAMRPVLLYDQFGRKVYIPSSAPKIGRTITIKKPRRFMGEEGPENDLPRTYNVDVEA